MDVETIFDRFKSLKILVIGDVMIDSYVWGSVDRISPEAPVPVIQVKRRENRLGGAANVALNLKSLGATPILGAVVGEDADGGTFYKLLENHQISSEGIIKSDERITTVKHRVLSGSQHMLRIDTETDKGINAEDTAALLSFLEDTLPQVDAVVFEDYDKGVLSETTIQPIIQLAKKRHIPTIVDPKKRNFWSYEGCSLFKPNLKELREGVKGDFSVHDLDEIEKASQNLKKRMDIGAALITLSENGIFATDFTQPIHFPAHKREIADVSGAGDTVVSVSALCLAAGLSIRETAAIANLSGGLVCEHLGVVPIKWELLKKEVAKISIH